MLVSLVERICAWLKHPIRGRGEYAIYCRLCRTFIGYVHPPRLEMDDCDGGGW